MAGSKPTSAPGADERLAAFVAEWRTATEATRPADRERAEAAVSAIYFERGVRPPRFLWVGSPATGAVVAQLSGPGLHSGLIGDPGLGTAWRRQAAARLDRRLGGSRDGGRPDLAAAGRRIGLGRGADAGRLLSTMISDALHVSPLHEEWRESAWNHYSEVAIPREEREGDGIVDRAAIVAVLSETVANLIGARLDRADEVGYGAVLQRMQPGQFDIELPAAAALFEVFDEAPWWKDAARGHRAAALARRLELVRSSGPWWARPNVAIMSERPSRMSFDRAGRVHSGSGPAIAYRDGFEVWAWHGVAVPDVVIRAPQYLSPVHVDTAWNAETRRVILERYGGVERYLAEGRSTLVHEDDTGRLWHKRASRYSNRQRAMVEVRNATPEPDGTRRTYLLTVPPDITTAREAVAWTFGMTASEYRPAVET
jgi:hypothetical protein